MALNSHQRGPSIVIVGAHGCGKTCLVNRYVEQTYSENCLATVGIDVLYLPEQSCGIKPSLWDASGHQRFRHIVRGYLSGAKAALLVYDPASRASLDADAADWLAALREEAPADVAVVLVGAKADLPPGERQVTPEAAAAFAQRHGLHACLEASAKTGDGVREAFEEAFDLVAARLPSPLRRSSAVGGAAGAASAGGHSLEPLILTPRSSPSGAAVGSAGDKPAQWNLGACFSAIGQLLCRRGAVAKLRR